jgi:hypothetical protein
MHSVPYYLELQKQLSISKGSSGKRLVDVPAEQELNSLWRVAPLSEPNGFHQQIPVADRRPENVEKRKF